MTSSTSNGDGSPVLSSELPRDEVISSSSSSIRTDSCLRARKDTIPQSLYGNLSLPFINLGFPKMGTSSIHAFFGCAGYKSVHYRCQRNTFCAECIVQSTQAGLPPLKKCGYADVFSQLDGKIN
eukprot:CAMPEP_0172306294 /NCGR_PEP_ID=MMETSP1058-20130122/7394_1 /TAXON_ID=83371 /ORGANISM="Detonula confervacea, Strain CCMP 353" /LENGTH=123 /DNA_ID=CAMNT_0013018127 /DNA_START=8 /DNA_END=376 /DNA_ORIENTATION=+